MSAGRLVLIIGAIALVAVVVIGVGQAVKDTSAPPKGTTLSASDLRRLDGAPPKLAALHRQANEILPGARKGLRARLAGLRGEHPAVVNIWAAWCTPCRAEMPVMQQVSLDLGKQVAFLGVDLRDNRESASSFLKTIPVTYPSYDDPSGQVYNAAHLVGVPSTLFYDRRGRQTFVHQGPYFEKADLVADIRRYALR